MGSKQVNVKIPENFYTVAQRYMKEYGFRNIQELALESMREKIFEKSGFDETMSEEEIDLIDVIIEESVKRKKFVSEKELLEVLRA